MRLNDISFLGWVHTVVCVLAMVTGGSALLANWAMVALVLRVSNHARQPVPDLVMPTADDDTQVVTLR